MMLGVVDEVLGGFDEGLCTIMLFLDLSAAFDTIDHDIMLTILSDEIGITGVALEWFRSFLVGRTQRVRVENEVSEKLEVLFGTPQGSVLGPKLFSIYGRTQPKVLQSCQFKASSFADDSNGMKKFALSFQYSVIKDDVPKCMKMITRWMNKMFLKINPDKTEILLLYPEWMEDSVIVRGVIIDEQCIRFSKYVKNVGLWLDGNLNFDHHVNKIVAHCYKLLKDVGRVRSVLSRKHTEMLVHAVTSSRLDYCNSVLFKMNKSNLNKLQKVQNSAARIVVRKRRRESISATLNELHWLRVESRIIFKILLLVHKYVRGKCPSNLQMPYKQFNCRPNDDLMLLEPACKTKYGRRRFTHAAPRLWNALDVTVRKTEKIETFKTMVKTLLFQDTEGFLRKAFKYN